MLVGNWLRQVERHSDDAILDDLHATHFQKLSRLSLEDNKSNKGTRHEVLSLWDLGEVVRSALLEELKRRRKPRQEMGDVEATDDDDEEEEEMLLDLDVTGNHRLQFKGWIDERGCGTGRIVCYNIRNGLEEMAVEGHFQHGLVHGKVRESEFEQWTSEGFYDRGQRHGYFRRFRWGDRKFISLTVFNQGRLLPEISVTKVEGGAFSISTPGRNVYLYPPPFKYGFINGLFGEVRGDHLAFVHGIPQIDICVVGDDQPIQHDPSTITRISRSPLVPDPYEQLHVYVAASKLTTDAGEGLFAKKAIEKGQLVCLFNGIRRRKEGRFAVGIDSSHEEWSDYRLTLDRSTDLDIPPDFISLEKYCATLGHKACHSFGEAKNAKFDSLWHPRFGLIMSIVALRDIAIDEEILVNYNYDVKLAPEWYRLLWQAHVRDLQANLQRLHQ